MEDFILKKKTKLQWIKDGDTNSKYFHSIIRGRKRKLFVHRIISEEGEWIQDEEEISMTNCAYFEEIFTGEENFINEDTLECIQRMVSQGKNNHITRLPDMEELKSFFFSMNPNFAACPDRTNSYFFKKCLHIMKDDLMGDFKAFFSGKMIPKYFSHSCIFLLPKVTNQNKFTEFRPIIMSNFTINIISKIVSIRLSPILPSLIHSNKSGFIKGRSIYENIMLVQEIIHHIKKPNVRSNVIIIDDITNAYDMVT